MDLAEALMLTSGRTGRAAGALMTIQRGKSFPVQPMPASDVSSDPQKPAHSGLWIAVVVVAMVVLQTAQKRLRLTEESQLPGPDRGDLHLEDSCLSAEYGHWKKRDFTPASPPESLREGEVAWIHSWTFQNGNLPAQVSFDQAGFMHWHDLTVCYEGVGWTVTQKAVSAGTVDTEKWPCVVARLQKPDASAALLVFSLFFDDGDPVDSLRYEPATSLDDQLRRLLGERLNRDRRTSTVGSIRQCQVFVPFAGVLDSETEASIIELHLQTREAFREKWLADWRSRPDN